MTAIETINVHGDAAADAKKAEVAKPVSADASPAVPAKRARPTDRVLPLLTAAEPTMQRRTWTLLAFLLAILYAVCLFGFWAPADAGVDQNAYLVGGRMIAEHGSPRLVIASPFQYTGAMFVRTDAGNYYPKYPIGLPLLY